MLRSRGIEAIGARGYKRGWPLVTIQGVTEECGFQALKILDWYGLSCFGLRSEG
ncbi:MAG: hypothetical protein ACO331_08445 [Prochlorothrix sp.]